MFLPRPLPPRPWTFLRLLFLVLPEPPPRQRFFPFFPLALTCSFFNKVENKLQHTTVGTAPPPAPVPKRVNPNSHDFLFCYFKVVSPPWSVPISPLAKFNPPPPRFFAPYPFITSRPLIIYNVLVSRHPFV